MSDSDEKFSKWQLAEVLPARAAGFTEHPDQGRGGNWCKFQKDDIHIWLVRGGWVRAKLSEERYSGHRVHETLEGALQGKGGRPL